MPARVEIDPHSGFCGGVIRAIGKAEDFLSGGERLYSLGAIVHNEEELARLAEKGLVTVGKEFLREDGEGKTLLIRAHGEPPETYSLAAKQGFKVIDCTCPVVLRLQERILQAHKRLIEQDGELIIFGKVGHAEVLGLLGQARGDAVVIENQQMLEDYLASGRIRLDGPVEVFSQTTKSPDEYAAICSRLRESMRDPAQLTIHDTICSQVATRHARLAEFASGHDVIVFVSGASSSNGKVLSDLCRSVNPHTHLVGGPEEIQPSWFPDGCTVGVCGATSTPEWLLEDVAAAIAADGPEA